MRKLYVANLPYSVKDDGLKAYFEQIGSVTSAKVITDRETGRSRGFGFVEMDSADKAMEVLNGMEFEGRALSISEARDRKERQPHGGRERDYRR